MRDLVMLVGPQAEILEDLEQALLIVGICLHYLKDEGRYVVGCPPNNDKMWEAIMELTGIEANPLVTNRAPSRNPIQSGEAI